MFDLYLITDPDPAAPDRCVAGTEAALSAAPAGRVAVQLRAKAWRSGDRLRLGRALRRVTKRAGAPLFVNTHAELARQIEADGLHLPDRVHEDPEAWSGRFAGLLSCACHDEAGLTRAMRLGATCVTLSPFGTSPGKGPPLDPQRFASLARLAHVPIFALGGIDEHSAPLALTHGAHGLAVIRAVYGAADPGWAVTRLLDIIDRVRASDPPRSLEA